MTRMDDMRPVDFFAGLSLVGLAGSVRAADVALAGLDGLAANAGVMAYRFAAALVAEAGRWGPDGRVLPGPGGDAGPAVIPFHGIRG